MDTVPIFIIIMAPLLLPCLSERENFAVPDPATWDEAREHCQMCYEDLVTVTYGNILQLVHSVTQQPLVSSVTQQPLVSSITQQQPVSSVTQQQPVSSVTQQPPVSSVTQQQPVRSVTQQQQHWIGLRENLADYPWSCWANGDPLIFQNWHPGRGQCATTTTTAAAATTTTTTTATTTTDPTTTTATTTTDPTATTTTDPTTTTATTTTDPTTTADPTATDPISADPTADPTATDTAITADPTATDPISADPTADPTATDPITADPTADPTATAPETSTDHGSTQWTTFYARETPKTTPYLQEDIIEECVAMLPSGPWVEIDCMQSLPYICYDERFDGNASFTMSAANATLSWSLAPGNISSYRVVVRGGVNTTVDVDGLTYDLGPLTPGTLYDARVYPVKCERDLNPQNASFYTKPLAVLNLVASNVTESSVVLTWERPAGGLHSYRVAVRGGGGHSDCTLAEWAQVTGLIAGGQYTLDVFSVVEDESAWSEPANLTLFTNPSKVYDVMVANVTNQSLMLSWSHEGNATDYYAVAKDVNNVVLFNETVHHSERRVEVRPLPAGTEVWLTVTALANDLEGDGDTARTFIVPYPIPRMNLTSTDSSINASWPWPSAFEYFDVCVQLAGGSGNPCSTTKTTSVFLGDLYAAANYTVTVTTVAGIFSSKPVAGVSFTKPIRPSDASVTSFNKTHATLEWTAPGTAVTTEFLVTYNSSFWKESKEFRVNDGSNRLAVDGLKAGTRYVFRVHTVSGDGVSPPFCVKVFTDWKRREITLSVLCSSSQLLHCGKKTVRAEVFKKLEEHFDDVLQGVNWKFDWKKK